MPERQFLWLPPCSVWGIVSPWDGVKTGFGILLSPSLAVGGSAIQDVRGPRTLQSPAY